MHSSSLAHTWYHATLRVAAATLAVVLAFVSGIISPATADLADHARSYVATAVGVEASVEPNELNVITARLTEREQELAEREAALEQREIEVGLNSGSGASATSDRFTYVMSSILFLLLVLIVINYALDFARARSGTGNTRSSYGMAQHRNT